MRVRYLRFVAVLFALAASLLVAVGSSQVAAQETAAISGTVIREFPIASPASGVVVDRFTALADGSRGIYIDSATTDGDGVYTFTVDPSVYVLTFIAPSGEVWESTGSTWVEAAVVATAGATVTVDQVLDSGIDPVVAVDDVYTFTSGVPVVEDLTRNDTVIRNTGSVRFVNGELPPGMRIAFPDVGGVYQELRGTPTTAGTYVFLYEVSNVNGDTDVATVTVTVEDPPPAPGTISGRITREFPIGGPAVGVVVDRFAAQADGSRGLYIDSATTNVDGFYSFTVEPAVYVLTFIAPDGEVWDSTGSTWAQTAVVAVSGQTRTVNELLDSGVVPVTAVDDAFTLTTDVPVVLDLTVNDTVITRPTSVEVVDGDLPPGMRVAFPDLGGIYQEFRGTPTTPGTYVFRYRVTNDNGDSDIATVTTTVQDPPPDPATLSGTITREFPIGGPAVGVVIDRFAAQADGSRGAYLDSATTDASGVYTFTVEPAVYVLTFIAPDGEVWDSTGSTWFQTAVAPAAGETVTVNQELDSGVVPVTAVDDAYTLTINVPAVLDLTTNDTVITRTADVDFVDGDLPPGMRVSFPQVGGVYQELRGTPTATGTYVFRYEVRNERGDAATATVTVTVEDPVGPPTPAP